MERLRHETCSQGCDDGRGATVERGQMPRLDVIDVAWPNLARMNNYLLGGKDNYRADREAGERLLQIAAEASLVAHAAHGFLLRVTSHLMREYQVRQFVVFGCGLPTPVGVHQVAQDDADLRVVYVDDDPLVLVHGRALWEDRRHTLVVRADPLQARSLLLRSDVREVIDLAAPVAAMFVSVLHTLPDLPDALRVLEQAAGVLAPGSFIAASHLVSEDAEVRQQADALLQEVAASGRWGRVRPRSEIASFFGALRLVAPGLVDVHRWRPGSEPLAEGGSRTWAEHGAVAMVC
ncbi:SAM-dependent methyltransferase [Actinacidiphila glaucinigra]|uniref:SAM-dependent methyltransferase n=1 Tax=Actinacidiphila glaucinigra TaxID=235986 RepID=UPI00371B4F5B